mmetsp:Transcript_61806/g.102789  ORF Transcript_61806/g.102789 Transcript_61806/m.102789 type:complete len:227 (+) Transcript_61806:636-1316(+)
MRAETLDTERDSLRGGGLLHCCKPSLTTLAASPKPVNSVTFPARVVLVFRGGAIATCVAFVVVIVVVFTILHLLHRGNLRFTRTRKILRGVLNGEEGFGFVQVFLVRSISMPHVPERLVLAVSRQPPVDHAVAGNKMLTVVLVKPTNLFTDEFVPILQPQAALLSVFLSLKTMHKRLEFEKQGGKLSHPVSARALLHRIDPFTPPPAARLFDVGADALLEREQILD